MRFWGLVLVILALVAFTPRAKSQTPLTSQNILTPTVGAWTGSVAGQNAGFSGGGNGPAFNATTNTITFGYTTTTTTQSISAEAYAIQHALNLSNSGIKIQGYNYSWKINNSGEQSGTLTGQVSLMRGTTALETYNYNYNAATSGFELKTGAQNFANEYSLLASDSMRLSFTGKDNRFWAGYYGPQVREPSITMNYTVDYCALNPLYSPSCSGYNAVLTSQNIAATTYAVNQALNLSGSGVMLHGYKYGYTVTLGDSWYGCTATNQDGSCSWYMSTYPSASVATSVRDNTHTLIRPTDYQNYSGTNSTNAYDFTVKFDSSRRIGTMGNFSMGVGTSGNALVTNKWSNWQYTPDFCVGNPLYSPTCDGYAAAYQAQMCSANPLYNSACPGYAEALFNQQCTANPLMNPSCPGYAAAYLTYQCSISPLYSTTCAGYAEAYKTQQCALDGLYDRTCSNYGEAYAKKNIINTDTTSTTKTTTPITSTVSKTEASTTISSDGAVKTEVSKTGDSNVDKAIATPTSTTNTAAAPSAPVQLTPPPAAVAERKQEQKQDDTKAENKPEGGQSAQGGQQGGQQEQKSDQPKTARQELQERRQEAAKAKAVEQGKDLANNMGKATDMEQQKQIQNVVIQAMGFTPGFDAYKVMMPDVAGYKPYSIYGNQRTVDNRSARSMFGGTDQLHNEIVNSQYK
jgi:hypothetical protein|tara:strand:+ start:1064 stop:3124 length:2061 start_codon:yes stop_codon:yes gene_type:complete